MEAVAHPLRRACRSSSLVAKTCPPLGFDLTVGEAKVGIRMDGTVLEKKEDFAGGGCDMLDESRGKWRRTSWARAT